MNDRPNTSRPLSGPAGLSMPYAEGIPALTDFAVARFLGVPFEIIAARHGMTVEGVAALMCAAAQMVIADLAHHGFAADPSEAFRIANASLNRLRAEDASALMPTGGPH
jgi:hypothetical protein